MSKSGRVCPDDQPCNNNKTELEENAVTRKRKDIRSFRQPTQRKIARVLL